MKRDTLYLCKKEAEKFLHLANAAIEESNSHGEYLHVASKTSGALRRSSMDLTRALADLRQNR